MDKHGLPVVPESRIRFRVTGVPILPWRWRRRIRSFFWTMLLVAMLALLWWSNRPPLQSGTIMFASDGDSLVLNAVVDGKSTPLPVRLLGIDAPELGQNCTDAQGTSWPCGRQAGIALQKLAPRGTKMDCQQSGKDRFDRALSRCTLIDGRDVAAVLVSGGWAIATNEDYLLEEDQARRARAGIWRGDFQTPVEWRAANPRSNLAIPLPS